MNTSGPDREASPDRIVASPEVPRPRPPSWMGAPDDSFPGRPGTARRAGSRSPTPAGVPLTQTRRPRLWPSVSPDTLAAAARLITSAVGTAAAPRDVLEAAHEAIRLCDRAQMKRQPAGLAAGPDLPGYEMKPDPLGAETAADLVACLNRYRIMGRGTQP